MSSMVAKKTFTFAIDDDLKAGLQLVRERDGVSEAETIRRALRAWLESKDAIKTAKRSARTPRKA
jgi:Arc/MetJ-type ribon-helix-helix transcriptional regulator